SLRFSLAPRFPLFPYTTLFRSRRTGEARCFLGGNDALAARPGFTGRSLDNYGGRNLKCPLLSRIRPCYRVFPLPITQHRGRAGRSEEHTSELQSPYDLVCRPLL